MAFTSLPGWDSFDHYVTAQIGQKWAGAGITTTINTTGVARTGQNCMQLTQDAISGGPVTRNIGQQSNIICGFAFNPSVLPTSTICNFLDSAGGDVQCFATLGADGSVSVVNHYTGQPGPVLGTSPAGLIRIGVWNALCFGIIFSTTGSVFVAINGQIVISVTGVNTIHSGANRCDGVQLSGPPSNLDTSSLFDDFFIGTSTNPAALVTDFPGYQAGPPASCGAPRIYPYVGDANRTPLDWTPLANTNWQETSQVPPPGDAAYVSASTVGNTDNYHLAPLAGEIPQGSFTVLGAQTVISARLQTAGSGLIAPNISGHQGNSQALTTSYSMYLQTYDVNPVTGVAFALPGDLATTFAGPEVTG